MLMLQKRHRCRVQITQGTRTKRLRRVRSGLAALARFWHHVSTQGVRGHMVVQNLLFSTVALAALALGLLAGGAVLLAIALQQDEVKFTYSDVGQLAALTHEQRLQVIQGGSARSRML